MVQHSDFLSPHYADGSLRTNKPIITYWVLIASFAALGINFFAARLPFLLAGAATIWVTYLFCLKLFQRRRIAILSAAILASNLQFIMLSLRATPDILQTLFMLLSLYGFCALVFDEDCGLRNYLLSYFGAALAVLTKGLLGAVLLGFMALFIIISKEKVSTLKRILHWPVIAAATATALSWYVYIYYQHGGEALWSFYNDQVAGKIDSSKFYIFLNIKDYIWGVFRNFIPWSLIVLAGYLTGRKKVHRFIGQHQRQVFFSLGWFTLLLVIFSFSTDCRTRYLLPAYPLLCVIMAALFWEIFEKRSIRRMWNWCCGIVLVLLGILGPILIWIGFILQWRLILGGAILIAAVVWAARNVIKFKQSPAPVAMGLLLLLVVADLRGFILPPFDFAPSKSLTACLSPEVEAGRVASVWSWRRANYLRQLYTISKGLVRVNYYPQGQLPQDLDRSAVIVFTGKEKDVFSAEAYTIQQCGSVFRDPAINAVWQGLLSGKKGIVMEAIQEPLYLARRKT